MSHLLSQVARHAHKDLVTRSNRADTCGMDTRSTFYKGYIDVCKRLLADPITMSATQDSGSDSNQPAQERHCIAHMMDLPIQWDLSNSHVAASDRICHIAQLITQVQGRLMTRINETNDRETRNWLVLILDVVNVSADWTVTMIQCTQLIPTMISTLRNASEWEWF